MRLERLRSALEQQGVIQLAVRALTRNIVDSAIDVANRDRRPVVLSVNRHLVDFDGGALGGWTTASFASYCRERDVGGWVLLHRDGAGARDHGGIERALRSITMDVECGFDIIHVAPSETLGADSERIERQTAFYAHAVEESERLGYDVEFELGTGQTTPDRPPLSGFRAWLEASCRRLDDVGLPMPLLVRAPLGVYSAGEHNVGCLACELRDGLRETWFASIQSAAEEVRSMGAVLSTDSMDGLDRHEAVRLSDQGLRMGFIGDSLAVAETKRFLDLCDATRAASIRGDFLEAAFATGQWMQIPEGALPESHLERAILCGRHLFGTPLFVPFRTRLEARLGAAGADVDEALRQGITSCMDDAITSFRSVREADLTSA